MPLASPVTPLASAVAYGQRGLFPCDDKRDDAKQLPAPDTMKSPFSSRLVLLLGVDTHSSHLISPPSCAAAMSFLTRTVDRNTNEKKLGPPNVGTEDRALKD